MSRHPPVVYTEEMVLETLRDCEGNQRKASEVLGRSQAWLAKWLKKHRYVQRIEWVKSTESEPAA